MCFWCYIIESWQSIMGFEPLVWYCRPVANGVWAKAKGSAFGAYTPCEVCTLVVCISHLVLLALCLYRICLIKINLDIQRFCFSSNYYNYMLGFLAFCCTVEPLFRLIMGVSIFNLDGQIGMAPFHILMLILLRWNFPLYLAYTEKYVI